MIVKTSFPALFGISVMKRVLCHLQEGDVPVDHGGGAEGGEAPVQRHPAAQPHHARQTVRRRQRRVQGQRAALKYFYDR